MNILLAANNVSGGDLSFDPTLPVQDAEATLNTTIVGYVRATQLFGRSANVGFALPCTVGNVQGLYLGEFQPGRNLGEFGWIHATKADRSGLRDPQFRSP